MELYCVKEKQHTPNVQGSEKVVITKNNRKLSKAKCASCGITKTRFMPGNYVSPPLRRAVEYSAMLLWQLVILQLQKESHILRKKSVEAGRYYASEAMRDPKLQKKAIN